MIKMYKEFKTNFEIKLGGDSEIDVLDFSKFLNLTYKNLGNISEKYYNDPYFKLKYHASKEGSISIDLSILTPFVSTLFNEVPKAIIILKIYLELFKLIKDLKGKKPKEINKVNQTITNNYGDINNYSIETINLYTTNPHITENLKKSLSPISDRESIEFKCEMEGLSFKLEKEDIKEMTDSREFEDEIEDETEEQKANVLLPVIALTLTGNNQWEFLYNKEKIRAKILDGGFLDKVHNAEIDFNSDSIIIADLLIQKSRDKTKYIITKVYEIRKRIKDEVLL